MPDNFVPAFLPFLTEKARYKFAFGGRGGAKSEQIADCLVLKSLEKHNQNILCTRQTQTSIADSVYSLIKRKIESQNKTHRFETPQHGIFADNKSQFIFKGLMNTAAQNSVKSIDQINYSWTEESHSVTQPALDLLLPSVRANDSELWFSWNPYAESDPVNKLFNSLIQEEKNKVYILNGIEYKWTEYRGNNMIGIKINYDGNPFFPETLEIERLNCFNNYYEDYGHIWLGETMSKEMNNIISGNTVKDAMVRTTQEVGQIEIGCDVARYGNDKTVIGKRKGFKCYPQKVFSKISTVETARHCMDAADGDKSLKIKVDDTGVGGGVTDYLLDAGYNAIGVNNNQAANNPDKYPNAISEMWFELRDIMLKIELPLSEKLKDQLVQRRYGIDKQGRRFVESKDEYKKRCGESPDMADELLLRFYNPIIKDTKNTAGTTKVKIWG
ncbi:MAG TPA: PBSX family phage terminase large subunit [Flavobacterium sp.]|nr:PBSX family phage terminase large subunit [Flavobacterium sp.]